MKVKGQCKINEQKLAGTHLKSFFDLLHENQEQNLTMYKDASATKWSAHMLPHFGWSAACLKLSWVDHKIKHYGTVVKPADDKSMHRSFGICVGSDMAVPVQCFLR